MSKVLSVIIPMYNSKAYIKKCLNSLLLAETIMEKLDILVVNDGSTDGCEALVSKYVVKYSNCISLLNKNNGGHGSAINYAIPHCKGTYFRILDADDWFDTAELEKFVTYLEGIDQMDLIISPYRTFNIQTKKYETVQANDKHTVIDMKNMVDHWSSYKQTCSLHALSYCTTFYRRLSKKLPEGVYYDDAFYSTIPAYQAEKIAIFTHPVYIYRMGDENQSVSSQNRVYRSDQLAAVIWAMNDAFDPEVSLSSQMYFYRKAASTVAYYLITVCLCHPQRKTGRKMARDMAHSLRVRSPILFKFIQKKYVFLYFISVLGISDEFFYKCMIASHNKQRKEQ